MTKVLQRTMLAVLTVAALLCLSLVFASGLNPAAAYAEETPVANAQSRATVKNIGSWDGSSDGLYQLINGGGEGKLVSSVSYNGLMNVEQNTTIDLNGYSIIRTGASGNEYGSVFYVKPGITLTIKDTSSGGNGTVTGGNSTYGGGVWIGAGSTLNLLGGNISGNTAGRGGGVYLESNSTFTMSGGRVRNNTATANGGGVYSVGSGLTISISGGEITGNNASSSGGGIYIDNSTLTMSGGSVSGNTAVTIGGGIHASGTFYLRGNATVTGNTVSGAKSNIYLPSDKKVTVNGQFTGSAGIYTQVNPSGASTRPIAATASYASYLDTSRFSFDKSGNYGFLISGTSLLAVQTANISFFLPSGVTWKSGYTAPTTYIVGDGLRLPTASNLNQPADTADIDYVLSLWYANSAFTGTRYSQISSSETGSFTLYAKLSALTKIKLDTAAQTFTYDGQPHAYTLTGTNADLTGYTVEYSSDGGNNYTTTVPTNAGSYYVRIQRSSDNTYADYYEVISNAVVIEKAALTRPTLTANMTYTYNGQLQTVSIDNLNRDVMTITGDTGTDAQNYTVQITPDGNHKWATGTENETIELSWTINKASFTPSITQSGWTYGEEMVPLVISGVLGTPAPIYHYSGTSNDGTYNETDSVTAPTVAGNYSLYITYAENTNTYAATSNSVNFTIARATFLPTVTIDGWTYGQTASAPDVTGNPSGADPAYRYTDKVTGGTIYDSAVAPTNAGEYTLGVTIGQTANYEAYSTTRDFTVAQAALTVTIADKTSVYGDAQVGLTAQITSGTLVVGDADPWSLDCSVTVTTGIGTYDITGTPTNDNYRITFAGNAASETAGNYTVTARAITVTITAKSSVYGNAHAELSGEVTSDNKIVNGDTDVYSLSCDVTATSAVGKYDITGTGTDNNYDVSFENETQSYEVTNADISEVSATGYEGTFDTSAHDAVAEKKQTTVNDQTATWKFKTSADGEYLSDMPQFTNAGTYTVWYEVTAPNHNAYTGSFTVSIAKADYDMSGVTLSDKKVNENGSVLTIVISGTLHDNVSVSYAGGNQIEPGEYTVTATFATTDNNYNAPAALTAKLTIRATEIVYEQGEGDSKEQSVIVGIETGMDPDVKLSITDLQKDEATKVEVKRGKYGRIAQAYDVKFLKNLTVVQPDGTVTVRLLIDESMRNRNDLKVYYIDADGNVTDMNATRDGDYLVFSTTHFSTYAIAFTGLLGWEIALIVIFSIIFLLLVYALIFFLLYKKGKLPGGFWDKFYFPLRMLFGDKAVLAAAYAGSGATYQVNKVAAPAPIETDDIADETAATITNDEQDDNSDEEADEETEEVNSETGFPNIQASPFTLSYTARLIQAGDDLKKFYSAVKNELLSYRMKSSIQGSGEKFRGNKKMLGYTSITGKTLKLYLALDPATIDKTSGAKKVSAKKYEAVPCMIRVRNPLALKKTLALIKRVAEENGLAKDADYSPHDYAADFPYESIEALIAKGLAKDNRPNGGIQQ